MVTCCSQLNALLWKNFKQYFKTGGLIILVLQLGVPLLTCITLLSWHVYNLRISSGRSYAPRPVETPGFPRDVPIVYTPNNTFMSSMMSGGGGHSGLPTTKGFATFEEGYAYLGRVNPRRPIVMFDVNATNVTTVEAVPKDLHYYLVVDPRVGDNVSLGSFKYDYDDSGFLMTQYHVTRFFTKYWLAAGGRNLSEFGLRVQRMPQTKNPEATRIGNVRVVFLFSTFFYVCLAAFSTHFVAVERATGFRKSLQLKGLTSSSYWFVWHETQFTVGFLVALLLLVMFCVDVTSYGAVFRTDPAIIILWQTLYVLNVLSFAFLMSYFMKQIQLAALMTAFAYATMRLLGVPYEVYTSDVTIFAIGAIYFDLGNDVCWKVVFASESRSDNPGLAFSEFFDEVQNTKASFFKGVMVMILYTFCSSFFLWCLDRIQPGDLGMGEPYYFFLKLRYWRPYYLIPILPPQEMRFFEGPPAAIYGIKVENLVKMYRRKVIVAGAHLNFYDGEITVLLGNKGAGKSTLISIIAGAVNPTRGTSAINTAYSTNTKAIKARENIGYGPQDHPLMPYLTCYEHLVFHYKLRGEYRTAGEEELVTLLAGVGLSERLDDQAAYLSVRDQRFLQLACVFCGNPKTILLDEPSNGLDENSRRDMWEFIKHMRTGRTILISSESADEAATFADRIAIMQEGVIKCYGTPAFLKTIYGSGYKVDMVRDEDCDVTFVTDTITYLHPEVQLWGINLKVLQYYLPEANIFFLIQVLHLLDVKKKTLRIQSFELSFTPLEEVLAKVRDGYEPKPLPPCDHHSPKQVLSPEVTENPVDPKIEAENILELMQLMASVKKVKGLAFHRKQIAAIAAKEFRLRGRAVLPTLAWIVLLFAVSAGTALWEYPVDDTDGWRDAPLMFALNNQTATVTHLTVGEGVDRGFADAYRRQFEVLNETNRLVEFNRPLDVDTYLKQWAVGNFEEYSRDVYVGAVLKAPPEASIGLYKAKKLHSEPLTVQLLLNTYVKWQLGNNYSVNTGAFPKKELGPQGIILKGKVAVCLLQTFIHASVMAVLPAIFISSHIAQKYYRAPELAATCGVNTFNYWFGASLADFTIFVVVVSAQLVAYALQPFNFLSGGRWILTLTTVMLYGLPLMPYVYVLHNVFPRPAYGEAVTLVISLIFGLLLPAMNTTADVGLLGHIIFMVIFSFLSPCYLMTSCMFYILGIAFLGDSVETILSVNADAYVYISAVIFLLQTIIWWALLLHLEKRPRPRTRDRLTGTVTNGRASGSSEYTPLNPDNDVLEERKYVKATSLNELLKDNAILLVDPSPRQVSDGGCPTGVGSLCQGVRNGSCFCLLGGRGSGKSTVVKMLTGELPIATGEVYVCGVNLRRNLFKAIRLLGYCPQEDAFHGLLTGAETLHMYARIKGVAEKEIPGVVNAVSLLLKMKPHVCYLTKTYSVDAKRKLAVAVAAIGRPKVVVLDEPTFGMSPPGRKVVWDYLNALKESGITLLVATSSYEECECLCSNVGIVVRGQLLCLGTTVHLRELYNTGNTVSVLFKAGCDLKQREAVLRFMADNFKGSEVIGLADNVAYFLVSPELPLYKVFQTIDIGKDDYQIEYYTVYRESLNQLFKKFVRQGRQRLTN